jgi:GT2 family glycosyltransferase
MNPPVAPAMATNLDRTYFNLPDGFLFMTAFDVGSSLERKNPLTVVNAFTEAFGGRTDVFLILKFHSAKFDVSAVQTMLRRVREIPNIIVRSQLLTDAETRALQACVDCLVSAHRSEGFGLNIAEFMLTGNPVIATGYSGNMDFTEADNSYLIPFVLQPLKHSSGPYLPGYLWAQPDHEALIAHMKRVAADPLEARQVGARGAATIRDRLSIEGIGRRIASRFDELGLTGTLPGFVYHLGNFSKIEPLPPELCTPVADPAELARHPKISVIVPVYNGVPEYLEACIDSVREQTYSNWELCLCNDGSSSAPTLAALAAYQGVDPRIRIKHLRQNQGIACASNAAATMAAGTWFIMLDSHDTLASHALAEIAAAVSNNAAIDALYADEDKLNTEGECCDTFFKPDWSPEHLESVMYTLHPLTVRASLFWKLGGFRHEYSGAHEWDLMLRISRVSNTIHHIPKILYHWRLSPGSSPTNAHAKPGRIDVEKHVLMDHVLEKYGTGNAVVEPTPLGGQYRVKHVIKENPPVTLIITTSDRKLQLPNQQSVVSVINLINSIMEKTIYKNYRILVVDNYDTPSDLKYYWEKNNISLISYIGSMKSFNYPDKVNFAVNSLKTEHVVLMHDNIKVINAEWLSALLEFSQNPEIGACSGKILHDDGTIQHVGIVLGIGGSSAHIYHGFPGDYVGYNGYTHLIRNYSAVTGALLATRRSVLNEVGSWDRRLAGNYNDVDICLRMRQHGYRIVYTPYSLVMHFEEETASEKTQDPSEVALFNTLWEPLIKNDPYYNPNLSRTRHDFSLQ